MFARCVALEDTSGVARNCEFVGAWIHAASHINGSLGYGSRCVAHKGRQADFYLYVKALASNGFATSCEGGREFKGQPTEMG